MHGTRIDRSRGNFLIRFFILDMRMATTVVALHLAALADEGAAFDAEWTQRLYLTPTVVTCLLHYRLRLKIGSAMLVHYLTTSAWTFLYSVFTSFALNPNDGSRTLDDHSFRLWVVSGAWEETAFVFRLGIALALAYGAICFAAIASARDHHSPPSKSS